jgi:hypothetical protein
MGVVNTSSLQSTIFGNTWALITELRHSETVYRSASSAILATTRIAQYEYHIVDFNTMFIVL